MTPDNDKTLRGLFHQHKIGFYEWNDRRDYRLKYEKQFSLGQKNSSFRNEMIGFLIANSHEISIVEDDPRHTKNEEDYIMSLGKYFHESKIYQSMRYIWSFGMCRDEDGNFTTCDCCGRQLNVFNTTGYGMCDSCEIEHNYKFKSYDLS